MYHAKVIVDSVSPVGDRLTTLEVEYPHAVHKDIMTHRMFDRNYQSFRAFPPERVIESIASDPFIPDQFRSRVKGMSEGDALDTYNQNFLNHVWEGYIRDSLDAAEVLLDHEVAKAQINFILQDLTWIRGIITSTDWDNFWALRSWPDNVRPEVKRIAGMMEEAYKGSTPQKLQYGQWHLPYVTDEEHEALDIVREERSDMAQGVLENLKKLSAARCARISYLTHTGHRDNSEDIRLFENLRSNGHMSPFGHQARPFSKTEWTAIHSAASAIANTPGLETNVRNLMTRQLFYRANLRGWHQFRKDIPNESDFSQNDR
jgi:hypothetical protein